MINIAICDDDICVCNEIENILINYSKKNYLKFNIDIFNCGNKFLKYLKMENNYNILFLDIEIGNLTGIDIGKYIRKDLKDRYIKIVYISSHTNYAMQLFDLKPDNFLVKPIEKNKLEEVLKEMLYDFNLKSKEFTFNCKNNFFRVKFKDIMYFESIKLSKNIRLYTVDKVYEFRDTLNSIENKLNDISFIKINKSMIVNFDYIKVFNSNEFKIILINNKELDLSKHRIKEIRSIYFDLLNERTY